MESSQKKLILPKVILYEIAKYLDSETFVLKFTSLNRTLRDNFLLNLYFSLTNLNLNNNNCNLTKSEILNYLVLYGTNK